MIDSATTRIEGPAGLGSLTGRPFGPTDWCPLTIAAVRAFAEATGDDQWIHLDEERARREGPFGGAVAQGNLTLAKAECLADELIEWEGFSLVLHRGWLRVSYIAPVLIPARIRVSVEIAEVRRLAGGWWEVERDLQVEADEGGLVCEARSLNAMLGDDLA